MGKIQDLEREYEKLSNIKIYMNGIGVVPKVDHIILQLDKQYDPAGGAPEYQSAKIPLGESIELTEAIDRELDRMIMKVRLKLANLYKEKYESLKE